MGLTIYQTLFSSMSAGIRGSLYSDGRAPGPIAVPPWVPHTGYPLGTTVRKAGHKFFHERVGSFPESIP